MGSSLRAAIGLGCSLSGGNDGGDLAGDDDYDDVDGGRGDGGDSRRARKRKRGGAAVDGTVATSVVGTSVGHGMGPLHEKSVGAMSQGRHSSGEIRLFIEAKGSVRPWQDGFLLSEHEKKVAGYCAGLGSAATNTRGRGQDQGQGQGHGQGHGQGQGHEQPTTRSYYRVAFISSLRMALLPACISFLRSARAAAKAEKASSSSAFGVDAAELQRVIQLSWVDLQHCTLDTASVTYRAVPAYRQQARP